MGTMIVTSRGTTIHLLSSEQELWHPLYTATQIRAYCHLHHSDHQRSLAINRSSGWGRCYGCDALVLLESANPALAEDIRAHAVSLHPAPVASLSAEGSRAGHNPSRESASLPQWQHRERAALLRAASLARDALGNQHLGEGWQVMAYLHTRNIPLEIAQAEGVGYLPMALLDHPHLVQERAWVARWAERMLFPLRSLRGNDGWLGRSLWRWQIGMTEQIHQALLEDEPAAPARWLKTRPAGWFCAPARQWGQAVVLVEGPFDRLALLSAGMAPAQVAALAGTSLAIDWLPEQVRVVLLALDADQGGKNATERLHTALEAAGKQVIACLPDAQDGYGTDWGERWRQVGWEGVACLCEQLTQVQDRLFRHQVSSPDAPHQQSASPDE